MIVRYKVPIAVLLMLMPVAADAAHRVSFVSEMILDNPYYIAAEPNGTFYVTSRKGAILTGGEGLIYVYSPDGQRKATFAGRDQNGDPYLKKPAGIAIDGDRLYVCDKSQDKVVIFSKDGKWIDAFGESGSAAKQFRNPEGIFIYQGILYVADMDNNRIQMFGSNGVYLRSIGNTGADEAALKSPSAVVVGAGGLIYAVDGMDHLVKMYRQDGSYAGKLSGTSKPHALAIADDGVFVTDVSNYNITKYALSGEKQFSFGTLGKGNVQFDELYGIATDGSGNVYAVDRSRASVQIIATEKGTGSDLPFAVSPPTSVKWIRDIPLKTGKMAWGPAFGKLYAVYDEHEALLALKEGITEKSIKVPDMQPAAVSVDQKGFLWVLDRRGSQLVKMNAEGRVMLKIGSSGSREGYFSNPADVLTGRDDLVYVADKGNNRLQVFNSEGVFVSAFTKAAANQPLDAPLAMAQDFRGNLYVLCEGRKVVVCLAPDGRVIREIGGESAGRDQWEHPVSLAVMGAELMVLDAGTGSVNVFTLDGKFQRAFGAKGNGKGDFKQPVSLVPLDGAQFAVSDPGNARLQIFQNIYTPAAPTGVGAKAGMRLADVTWNALEDPFVEMYRVFRRKDGESVYRQIGATRNPAFRDTTVLPDGNYRYRVSARSADGNENISGESAACAPLKYSPSPPIRLEAKGHEWSVDLTWQMDKTEYVDHFRIYRDRDGESLLARPRTAAFTEGGLESDTAYTYLVSAVSVDGLESDPAVVTVRTTVAVKTPLEIDILEMSDIFSNTYKIYETEGIGKVRLTNNTRDPIASLKLSFYIKEYMDFPTEVEMTNLLPKESRETVFKAVFNNKLLDVTEDTPVQAQLAAAYYENQKLRTASKSKTVKLYEKHRMVWATKDRIATFVTPKDPVVLEFTRSVVTQYSDIGSPLVYAAAIYEYMGLMGMSYLKHPANPYQIVDGKTNLVDYIQYPRDTLKRNSGVCTDLVVLYAAALEGMGIRTLILGTPDHLFLMFAVGQVSDLGENTMNNMFVIHEGTIWAPVELTLVGSKFMKAWETGSKTYYEWKKKGIEMTDLASAWSRYKPATLPSAEWHAPDKSRKEMDKHYGNSIEKLHKIWLKYTSNRYYVMLANDPKDVNAYLQLGIIYGEAGDLEKAKSFFEKAESMFPGSADIKNNVGNIWFLKGKYDQARKIYEKAAEMAPGDPYILVNLSQCYLKLNKKEKAAQIFRKAVEKDAEIARKYRGLAMELL